MPTLWLVTFARVDAKSSPSARLPSPHCIRNDRSVLGEPDVVRIDRATRWGNPFVIGRDGSRAEVIAKYRARLWREIRAGRIGLEDLAARQPATPFPLWAEHMARRLAPYFDGASPAQCIVNEYRPGQGIGMHADHRDFGAVAGRPARRLCVTRSWPVVARAGHSVSSSAIPELSAHSPVTVLGHN